MDLRAILMGLAFALMWSSAFTSARMIVAEAAPLWALAVRFLVSGLIGVAIAAAGGQSARLSATQWRAVVVFGLCQNALYLGCNFVAMQRVEANLAAVVASTLPLLVAVAGLVRGERLGATGWAGLAAGFAGVALILGARLSGGAVDPAGLGLCALGVAALTVATLSVRGVMGGGGLMMVVGLQMLVGAAILFPVALAFETPWIAPSPRLAAAFAYTTLVPGLLATWVWFRLVGRIGAVGAASFHFLNPVFGVAVAGALLGEVLGPSDALGVAVVAAGILAVQRARGLGAKVSKS
jgi:drug/metabolite transporter (DMT)-like permease